MNWIEKLKIRFRPFVSTEEMPNHFIYTPRFCTWYRINNSFSGNRGDVIEYLSRCERITRETGNDCAVRNFNNFFNSYVMSVDGGKTWIPFGIQTAPGRYRVRKKT